MWVLGGRRRRWSEGEEEEEEMVEAEWELGRWDKWTQTDPACYHHLHRVGSLRKKPGERRVFTTAGTVHNFLSD